MWHAYRERIHSGRRFGFTWVIASLGVGLFAQLLLCAAVVQELHRLGEANQATYRAAREAEQARFATQIMVQTALAETAALAKIVGSEALPACNVDLAEPDRMNASFDAAERRLASIPMNDKEQRGLTIQRDLQRNVAASYATVVRLAKKCDLVSARGYLYDVAFPAQKHMLDTTLKWAEQYQRDRATLSQNVLKRQQATTYFVLAALGSACLLAWLAAMAIFGNHQKLERPAPVANPEFRESSGIHGIDADLDAVIGTLATLKRHRSAFGAMLAAYRLLENELGKDARHTVISLRRKLDLEVVLKDNRIFLRESLDAIQRVRKTVHCLHESVEADAAKQHQLERRQAVKASHAYP